MSFTFKHKTRDEFNAFMDNIAGREDVEIVRDIAEALYTPGSDEKKLAAFGLSLEDYGDEEVEVWPEHLHSFLVFNAMSTQWRVGASGPTGLDDNALPELWRRLSVPKRERNRGFIDLQEMERAAWAGG